VHADLFNRETLKDVRHFLVGASAEKSPGPSKHHGLRPEVKQPKIFSRSRKRGQQLGDHLDGKKCLTVGIANVSWGRIPPTKNKCREKGLGRKENARALKTEGLTSE